MAHRRRLRNLALFGLVAVFVVVGIVVVLRRPIEQTVGVSADLGPGGRAELVVPEGYEASVFAEGLATPRFMAFGRTARCSSRSAAPTGSSRCGIATVTESPTRRSRSASGFECAHSVAFEADGSLLVAGETTLFRLQLGRPREADGRVVLEGLTTGGLDADGRGPPGRRAPALGRVDLQRLLEKATRAARRSTSCRRGRLEPGLHERPAKRGGRMGRSRHRPGLGDNMGRDLLGDDLPPETVYEVVDGADAGWPRCHAGTVDPSRRERAPAMASPTAMTFGAHTRPLGTRRAGRTTSWSPSRLVEPLGKAGYALWWLPWNGEPAGEAEPFATGFLPAGARCLGRPAGLAVGADGALYVSRRQGRLHLPDRAPVAWGRSPRAYHPSVGIAEVLSHVERAVDEQSVADLVEPLITPPPEGPPEYVATAGRTLARERLVTITVSETQRVVATVTDGDDAFEVELASTAEGLLARCNCSSGSSGHLCPHSFATAFVTWNCG